MATGLDRLVTDLRRSLDPATDRELLDKFVARRDADAFEALVRRHGPAVLAACRKVSFDAADADDAFQTTFLTLMRDARSIRRPSVAGWLVVVAHRTAVRLRRARQRRHSVESRSPSKATRSPDISWQEAVAILHDELDRLPARHRQVLLLCYLEGKSRDEAASELGWTNQAVKGALERGRDRLRGRLQKRGIALSAGLLTTLTESGAAVCPATLVARTVQQATGAARSSSAIATFATVATTKSKFAVGLAVAAGLLVGVLQLAPPREAAAEPPAIKAKPLDLKPENLPPATVGEVAVRGRVVGPDGKPVAGANLFVQDGESPKPIPQGATKADGSFALTVPAQAGFHYRYVIAMAPALGCDWAKIPMFGSGKEVVLKLPEEVPIKGRLVDLEGKPVAGAAIRLELIDTAASDNLDEFLKAFASRSGHEASVYLLDKRLLEGDPLAALFHATSDADGRFTIRGIGRDRIPGFIIVSKAHAQRAFRVVTRPGYKDTSDQPKRRFSVVGPDFTLILAPGKEVTGVVRDAETKMPLGGVRVAVQFVAEAEFLRRWHHVETTTDLAGRYSLRGLEAGKSSVVLFDAEPGRGYLHAYSEAPKPNDFGPSSLDMSLRRGVIVEGRVTDKETGKPIRANLWYRPLETNDFLAKTPGYEWLPFGAEAHDDTTRTDADGRYKLSVLPGPGLLHFQTHDLNPTVYPTTRLDSKDGDRGVYGPVLPTMLNMIVFKTGGRGGHYGPESINAYHVIDPRPGVTSIRADVALWAGHTRKLKILDPDGKPLEGSAATGLSPTDGFTSVGTDAIVRALDPETPRTLMVRHDARKLFALVTMKGLDSDPSEVRLEPTAIVIGRFVDQDGKPLAGPFIIQPSYQDHPNGTLLNSERMFRSPRPAIETDKEGRFRLENLPTGIGMKLIAHTKGGNDYWYTKSTFKLEPGKVKDLGDWKRE